MLCCCCWNTAPVCPPSTVKVCGLETYPGTLRYCLVTITVSLFSVLSLSIHYHCSWFLFFIVHHHHCVLVFCPSLCICWYCFTALHIHHYWLSSLPSHHHCLSSLPIHHHCLHSLPNHHHCFHSLLIHHHCLPSLPIHSSLFSFHFCVISIFFCVYLFCISVAWTKYKHNGPLHKH